MLYSNNTFVLPKSQSYYRQYQISMHATFAYTAYLINEYKVKKIKEFFFNQ